ncbi:hypothetical protein [Chryseobacterium phocaeense]|uniref:hypothetical protein n=1 Tax=Chryseobacterium phocaeense TaxID=1816690 RepID=UPI00111AFE79|nr:hypothetical protein [Chryseobacterium phocaeense]
MKIYFTLMLCIFALIMVRTQTKFCDCSGPLDKDLKKVVKDSEYSNFKNWLYEYYQKDETSRSSMKKSAENSFTGKVQAVVKSIPTTGSVDKSSSKSKSIDVFYNLEEFFLRNRYITDESLNELFASEMSDGQLSAYKACLKYCTESLGSGISTIAGGDPSDVFYIQIKYDAQKSGDSVTLLGDAQYNNLVPVGSFLFRDGVKLKDRQTKIQYFKRLDPYKDASFSFNLKESIAGITPVTFDAIEKKLGNMVPVGTIIASVLNYNSFLKANNYDVEQSGNMQKMIWVPCDGRDVMVSEYGLYSGGRVPDLRGVFLRGINDYGVAFPSTKTVNNMQKNPENKIAGEFQADITGPHSHGWTGTYGNGNPDGSADRIGGPVNNPLAYPVQSLEGHVLSGGGPETRPKNITVYYYIKINN